MKSTPFIVFHTAPNPRLRVYCFSYAGGSAAYFRPWQALLGPDIQLCAIELPGRGTRFHETPMSRLQDVVEGVAEAVSIQDPVPFAFFGHSLGALLAFETARRLRASGQQQPGHIFVSGCQAPRHRSSSRRVHLLDDVDFKKALAEYKGTPPAVLDNDELMALFLPTLRADFRLSETYVYAPGPTLDQPLTVLAAHDDPYTSKAEVEAWASETSGSCAVRWFEGEHFFITPQRESVIRHIRAALLAPAAA
jgi:medium-chain acyl-[acyl-carrier-protein] hydrolase